MQILSRFTEKRPLLSAILTIILTLVATSMLVGLFGASGRLRTFADPLARLVSSTVLLLILARAGRGSARWLKVPSVARGKHWLAIVGLMGVIVVNAFLKDRVDFDAMHYEGLRVVRWLLNTYSTGLWEELLFRGAVFFLLYRAWGRSRKGLFGAALVQALLFGALHLVNLSRNDLGDVLFQTGYAAMIGFGFAGLTAYAGSIWPAVLLHGSINAAGNFDFFFATDGYVPPEPTLAIDILIYTVFLLFGALPGYWCLRRASLTALQ